MNINGFAQQKSSLKGARILVVDDERDVLMMTLGMLRMLGCEASGVGSAAEARIALRDSPCDAMLLDVNLPDANGHEFLHELRQEARFQLLPVMIVTGSADREDRLKAEREPFTQYLVKPFDAELLALELAKLLEQKRILDRMQGHVPVAMNMDQQPDMTGYADEQRLLEGARILVVDDESEVRGVIEHWLVALKCITCGVSSAEEAWASLEQDVPDVLVLDVNLPGRNGLALLDDLRADERFKRLPVIMLTGSESIDDRMRAEASQIGQFITKRDCTPNLLAIGISKLLKWNRMLARLDDGALFLIAMAELIDNCDPYTRGHSARVAEISQAIGVAMGLGHEEQEILHHGALVHDVGKVGLQVLLLKPGPFTAEERAKFQEHPVTAYNVVRHLKSMAHTLPVVRHHHEHFDGSGYPDGLAGEAIPLVARICAYADVYDALATARPYRAAYAHEDAVEIVRHEAAIGHLDPALLPHFETVAAAMQAVAVEATVTDAVTREAIVPPPTVPTEVS